MEKKINKTQPKIVIEDKDTGLLIEYIPQQKIQKGPPPPPSVPKPNNYEY